MDLAVPTGVRHMSKLRLIVLLIVDSLFREEYLWSPLNCLCVCVCEFAHFWEGGTIPYGVPSQLTMRALKGEIVSLRMEWLLIHGVCLLSHAAV